MFLWINLHKTLEIDKFLFKIPLAKMYVISIINLRLFYEQTFIILDVAWGFYEHIHLFVSFHSV